MLEIGSGLRIHSNQSGIMVGGREGVDSDPDGKAEGMSPQSPIAAVLTVATCHRNGLVLGPVIALPPWSCMGGRARNTADPDQGSLRAGARCPPSDFIFFLAFMLTALSQSIQATRTKDHRQGSL